MGDGSGRSIDPGRRIIGAALGDSCAGCSLMEKLLTEVERNGPLLSLANLAVGYSSTWFTGMIRLVCRPTVGGSSGIGAKGSTGTGGLSMAFAPE